MKPILDLSGRKYNKLLVIKYAYTKDSQVYWNCLCDCGNETTVYRSDLVQNKTKSCGCLKKLGSRKTHGFSNSGLYNKWYGLVDRCTNQYIEAYKDYGGRGITVCDEWKNDFLQFYNWSMENGYKKGLQIDRIDNNGNYCPENCRFVTPEENCRNKRNNLLVEVDGVVYCFTEALEKFGKVSRTTAQYRIKKGIDPKIALMSPPGQLTKYIK